MPKPVKPPIGDVLLTRKLLTREQLDAALRDQERTPGSPRIVSLLVDRGALKEEDALRALSEHAGVPGIELTRIAILLDHLDVMPREMSEVHRMLPVLVRGDRLFTAMANPHDVKVIDELEFVSGKKVYAYVALASHLARVTAAAHEAKARGEKYYLGSNVPPETLAKLGLTRSHMKEPRAAPVPPQEPAVVVDRALQHAGQRAELSAADFGTMSPDVSQMATLDDEQRAAIGLPPARTGVRTERRDSELPTVDRRAAKTVLVVDDEEDIRRMLRRVLQGKGHRVIEADRGLVALRLVKEEVPDVIVLDAMLPEIHGFDIARRIKGSERYGRIPIIMISAVYRGWRIAEDLKASYGIDAYIEKPFRLADVTDAVARALDATAGRAVERDPEAIGADAERALEAGVAAYKTGDLDGAIAHLARGVQLDPLAYRLHFHLALLHGKKGNIYDAIQELERARELNPNHFPALKNLAVLYEKAGFRHKALETWERCVHAAPDAETRAQVKEHLMTLL